MRAFHKVLCLVRIRSFPLKARKYDGTICLPTKKFWQGAMYNWVDITLYNPPMQIRDSSCHVEVDYYIANYAIL